MNHYSNTLSLCIAIFAIGATATAQDWNDAIVRQAEQTAQQHGWDDTTKILYTEMLTESERTRRSGVTLIEYGKRLNFAAQQVGLPELTDVSEYMARVDITDPAGNIHSELVPVSPDEVERMKMETAGTTPEEVAEGFALMSIGLLTTGGAIREGIKDSGWGSILTKENSLKGFSKQMPGTNFNEKCAAYLSAPGEKDFIGGGIVQTSEGQEWQYEQAASVGVNLPEVRFDPVLMMLGPACMMAVTAEDLAKPTETYQDVRNRAMVQYQSRLRDEGTETVGQYPARRISMDNLSLKQMGDNGEEIMIDTMTVWIDTDYYKRRKIRLDGILTENGKSRDFFMERENSDYRRVGNTHMYEPYKEVMTFGGAMDAAQMRQLAEANKELAKLEKELAALPASQRAMMEGMLGGQIQQLRDLASGGAVSVEVITTDITLNPDLSLSAGMYKLFDKDATGISPSGVVGMMPGGDTGGPVVQMIQTNLTRLGYQPGPADGVLTDQTRSAISQYQQAKGIAVTGQPSAQLAARLQDEADGL